MRQLYATDFTFISRLLPPGKATPLFLFLFLLNFSFGFGQGVTNPSLIHSDDFDVETVNISLADIPNLESKANRLIISTDFNSKGEKFVLTFGNGIQKVVDNNNTEEIISGNLLFSPLDFAIDSQDRFYVANSNNRKILVFDSKGDLLSGETIGSGNYGDGPNNFKGPTGIAFDSNGNLYVADNYSGNNPEASERGHVKVFFKNGDFTEFHKVNGDSLNYPYRIAANNQGRIFLSEVGPNNGRVQVIDLDSNLNPVRIDILEGPSDNIGSPGDIVIDNEDLIYIADFGDKVSLRTILEARNEPLNLLDAIGEIQNGIREEIFRIKIYEKNLKYKGYILDKIDLPVDLAFGACGKLSVNNLNISGSLFTAYSFDFDLEIFKRTPYFDTENPIANCKSGQEFTLENGKVTITAEQIDDGSYDNCRIEALQLSKYTFEEEGEFPVTLTVTDAAGNVDTCTTQIAILPANEEETPPVAICNNFEIVLDSNGVASITAEQVYGGNEDLVFEIDKENFTCADLGENEVTLTVTDSETELSNTCTAIITVTDNQDPIISCVAEGKEFQLENGGVTITVSDIELSSSDNCSISTKSLSETTFTTSGTKNITLTVVDEAGNSTDCSTTIEILPEEETYSFECIGQLTVSLGEEAQNSGVTEIPTSEFITSDTSNLDFELTNQQFTCEDIGTNPLTIRATNKTTGEEYSCEVEVSVVDLGAPLIICPAEPITLDLPQNGYEVPNFFENRISDNCNNIEDLDLVQDVEPGTVLDEAGTYTINLTATDTYDNVETCEIIIILEENDLAAPQFEDCPPLIQRNVNTDQCQARVDFDAPTAYDDSGDLAVALVSDLGSGDLFPVGSTTVTYQATGENGETITCSFEVVVVDNISPEIISCPDNIEIEIAADQNSTPVTYTVPEFTDNCGVVDIQRNGPASGENFSLGQTVVTYTASDEEGNEISCSFEVLVERENESTEFEYRCIEEADLPNITIDEDCELKIPSYTFYVQAQNFNPAMTQTYEKLTEDTYLITVEIREFGSDEFVGECEFSVNVVDLIPPSISCPGDQVENFDSEEGFVIPNYENMARISDNCGEVSFRQEPETGEIIYNNTTVNLFVEDERGLAADCSFEIQLTQGDQLNINCQIDQNVNPNEDCRFSLEDYTDTASVNLPGAVVTQSPAPGTVISENTQIKLTATLDGQTDECFFMVNLIDNEDPVANCVSGYVVNLDASGNATLAPEELDNNSTDNCGIVSMALSQTEFTRADIGEVPITLTVRDDAGNMDTCETTVEVVDEASGDFECRENIVVGLNANGEASLNLQDLYTGNASGIILAASRLNFNCNDLGEVQIQLDYSGIQTGNCTINVEVRDELPPEINTNIVELSLDAEGFAYLEESDILAEDNCSEQLIYRFSRSVFNCEDVGSNTINVEVEDVNGNIARKNIEVKINGEACEIPDNEELQFLFIYPNPNNGIFTIAVPEGMLLEQVRVFDSRGRFILQKDYKTNARFYRMTIEGLASSVYTLQIFTNEGVIVKRVIISR